MIKDSQVVLLFLDIEFLCMVEVDNSFVFDITVENALGFLNHVNRFDNAP